MILDSLYRFIGRLRWLRLGIRYRLILPLPKKDLSFSADFFGYKYVGKMDDYIDRYVYYFGSYEMEELMCIKKFIKKDSVVFDIGANTGHHSLFFSKYAKEVYSFEPYLKMYDKMLDRFNLNNIDNIKTFNIALGSDNTSKDFFAPTGINMGIGSFVNHKDNKSIGKLSILKGDDFIKKINLNNLDFVKIDVEGMEMEVLEGLSFHIKKFRPVIFVEMDHKNQMILDNNKNKYLEGYNIYILNPNNHFLLFFNKLNCKLEPFKPRKSVENLLCIPSEYKEN